MSSTRLINDKGEYCQEQRNMRLSEQFALYTNTNVYQMKVLFLVSELMHP